MPFKPGQSGNPLGPKSDKPFRTALKMEEALAANGEATPAKPGSVRWIARQLLIRAGGDTQAAKEVRDTFDGRPAQAIVGDSEHDPVSLIITGVPRASD